MLVSIFIASVTSSSMPLYLRLTALWGGQAGSLLFWSWLLAGFSALAVLRRWERDRDLLPWVIVVTAVTLAFFLSLNLFLENPFVRWWLTPGGETAALFQPANATLLTLRDSLTRLTLAPELGASLVNRTRLSAGRAW